MATLTDIISNQTLFFCSCLFLEENWALGIPLGILIGCCLCLIPLLICCRGDDEDHYVLKEVEQVIKDFCTENFSNTINNSEFFYSK